MLTFIFIVFFFIWLACSAFLVLVILNQEPKGGGIGGIFAQGGALGDTFGSPGQKELRAFTRLSATVYFVLTILLVMLGPSAFKPHARLTTLPAATQPVAEQREAEAAAARAAARTGTLQDTEAGLVLVEEDEFVTPTQTMNEDAAEVEAESPAAPEEAAAEVEADADEAAAATADADTTQE